MAERNNGNNGEFTFEIKEHSEHLLMRTITAGAGSSTLYHGMAESQSWI